jgi:uncharacterized protein YaaN involved in tellurite resistance
MSTTTATAVELNPPELLLTPPQPVAPVEKEQAAGMVKLEPAKLAELDVKVEQFVNAILNEPVHSDAFKSKISGVHTLANDEIRAAANISNRLLEKPVRAMNSGLFDEGSAISKSLLDLRVKIEELDPVKRGDMFQPRKLLGFIPWGTQVQDYFREYQSAQTHLDAIIKSLYNGQDELRKDNAAVEQEKANAWHVMEKLEQYVYVGKKIDTAIEAKLAQLDGTDPEKARVVREELLFYVRQKVQDLLTQLAVTIQGYLAMDMIRKNNLELIKGVDRATTTTISALRTAVIVAQALANQKLVLDQIGALNTTTSNMIESTSAMLKNQAGKIHEQASSAAVSLDKLKLAFKNVYETMDMVSSYKTQALSNMQKTVDVLSQEVEKSKTYLDRVRDQTVREVSSSLDTASSDDIKL